MAEEMIPGDYLNSGNQDTKKKPFVLILLILLILVIVAYGAFVGTQNKKQEEAAKTADTANPAGEKTETAYGEYTESERFKVLEGLQRPATGSTTTMRKTGDATYFPPSVTTIVQKTDGSATSPVAPTQQAEKERMQTLQNLLTTVSTSTDSDAERSSILNSLSP